MNKSYRLIYNEITQTWVAVAEIAKARGKRASGTALLAAVALSVQAAPPNPPAAMLTVNQTSNRAALDWKTFNVGKSASVNFN